MLPFRSITRAGRSLRPKNVRCNQPSVNMEWVWRITHMGIKDNTPTFVNPQVFLNERSILLRQEAVREADKSVRRAHRRLAMLERTCMRASMESSSAVHRWVIVLQGSSFTKILVDPSVREIRADASRKLKRMHVVQPRSCTQ
jgi:hypothetical protein